MTLLTFWLYAQCVLMFLLGQAVDLLLIKIPELRKLWSKSNEAFSWKKYWNSDWNVIIGTFALGAMLFLGLDQIIKFKPWVLDWVKWICGGAGFMMSSIIVSRASRAKKFIMSIIDKKTNIADSKDC